MRLGTLALAGLLLVAPAAGGKAAPKAEVWIELGDKRSSAHLVLSLGEGVFIQAHNERLPWYDDLGVAAVLHDVAGIRAAGHRCKAYLLIREMTGAVPKRAPERALLNQALALCRRFEEKAGWDVVSPPRQVNRAKVLRLGRRKVRLWRADFAANDNRTLSSGTGETEVRYYSAYLMQVAKRQVALVVQNADQASPLVDGVRLSSRRKPSRHAVNVKLTAEWSGAKADGHRNARITFRVPKGMIPLFPSGAIRNSYTASPECFGRWSDGKSKLVGYAYRDARFGLEREWEVWRGRMQKTHAFSRRAGSMDADGARLLVADGIRLEDERPCGACAFSVNGTFYVLVWERGPKARAKAKGVSPIRILAKSLRVWRTDIFRAPSTKR